VEVSRDGQTWRTVLEGNLGSTWNPHTLRFAQSESVAHLRFTALSGFGEDPSAALAELAVLYAGEPLAEHPAQPVEYRRVRSTSTDVEEGN
jgi:hypothetical protein